MQAKSVTEFQPLLKQDNLEAFQELCRSDMSLTPTPMHSPSTHLCDSLTT
jgi:hypothetical protein